MVTIVLIPDPDMTTPIPHADLLGTGAALGAWINAHPGPAYSQGLYGLQVLSQGTPVPTAADRLWPVVLKDRSDVAGALGYHTISDSGHPAAYVFVGDCARFGVPWSAVAAHEIAELLVNRFVTEGIRCLLGGQIAYAFKEACDPVEDSTYSFTQAGGTSVAVSNFVLPAYWRPGQPGPYDHLRRLTAPLTPSPNGRQSFEIVSGPVQTVDGRGQVIAGDADDTGLRVSLIPKRAAP